MLPGKSKKGKTMGTISKESWIRLKFLAKAAKVKASTARRKLEESITRTVDCCSHKRTAEDSASTCDWVGKVTKLPDTRLKSLWRRMRTL